MTKSKFYYYQDQALLLLFSLSYSAFLSYVVFFAARRRFFNERIFNLIPFHNMFAAYTRIHDTGVFNFYGNLFGNVLLFMPFGFLLAGLFKIRRFSMALLAGFLLSVGIEITQYIFMLGVADVDDVILNTLGTGMGFIAFQLLRKWFPVVSFPSRLVPPRREAQSAYLTRQRREDSYAENHLRKS